MNKTVKHEEIKISADLNDKLKKHLPNNYIYFHAKRKILNELGWGIVELKLLFTELLKYSDYVVLTKDIELDENSKIFMPPICVVMTIFRSRHFKSAFLKGCIRGC